MSNLPKFSAEEKYYYIFFVGGFKTNITAPKGVGDALILLSQLRKDLPLKCLGLPKVGSKVVLMSRDGKIRCVIRG